MSALSWILLGVATLCLLVWFAIYEWFGAAVVLGIMAFGLWAIMTAAEALRGYPRGDRSGNGQD
ncbi:MAG TPA: hypothetical protein VJU58_13835 [Microbacterium sp.]|nr:hypothetical protein [Microbacterium sp.]